VTSWWGQAGIGSHSDRHDDPGIARPQVTLCATVARINQFGSVRRCEEVCMPVPTLHQTDLFRPHIDPDDHWDLACVYALAAQGHIDLRGVLLDFPPSPQPEPRAPDVEAIAQLNTLTGLAAPFRVGSSISVQSRTDHQQDAPVQDRGGVSFVLRSLREAQSPVVIHIVGSCRDVALAANTDPALFTQKCAGIYLNAGTGNPDPHAVPEREYNVLLNPSAYGAIFAIDCPIYWMPCYETFTGETVVRQDATWYDFRQDDILPHLAPAVQRYFAYMLSRSRDTDWLGYLTDADTRDVFAERGPERRNMWCTGGFFHSAGLSVTREGEIVSQAEAGGDAVFGFEPIDVACDEAGMTTWHGDQQATKRFIFRVRDTAAYPRAMTTAMKTLLTTLPDGA